MSRLPRRLRLSHQTHARRGRARLHVEQLEDRRLMYAADLVATQIYDPGHILVGDIAGDVQKIELPAGSSIADALAQYDDSPLYAYAEPDYVVQAAVIPNDTSFASLYGMHNTGQSVAGVVGTVDADIDAPEAWDINTGSTEITVGVIDTGIDYRHQDLYLNVWINQEEIPASIRANLVDTDSDGLITFYDLNNAANQGSGKISDFNANGRIDGGDLLADASGWEDGIDQDPYLVGATTVSRVDDLIGWNFVTNTNNPLDDNNHGTHVAGTIGAMGNNGVGVAGVVWKTQLAALKFLSSSGSGTISAATAALHYAVGNGMEITNNSWGGGGFSQAFASALAAASSAGQIFVAAAGNSSSNNDAVSSYPSNYALPNVVAVAATNNRDGLANFSNYGATTVDLGAPGVSIQSTIRNGGYASYSGTSMATPHVAGSAALVWSQHPEWSFTQVIGSLFDTADPVAALAGRAATGGRLNVNDAVRTDLGDPPPPPADTTGPQVTAALPNSSTSVSSVRLTFNEAINPTTFDATDVTSFVGPAGTSLTNVGVSEVFGSGGTQFDVTFSPLGAIGTYSFDVGPDIRDAAGNAMDQNGDGTNGGAGDAFQTSFTLVATQTFSNNTRYLIRDRTSTYSYITVGPKLTIADLDVRLNITHTYDSDLVIELRHPSGTTVLLSNRRGGSGDNFTNTTFDDEASVAIASGVAPFAGSFRPEASLTLLDGRSAAGTWRLRVYDAVYQDVGTLNSWSLIVTPTVGASSLADTKVWALESGDFAPPEFAFASVSVVARSVGTATEHAPDDRLANRSPIVTRQTWLAVPESVSSRPMNSEPVRLWSGSRASDALFAEIGASSSQDELSGRLESLLGRDRRDPQPRATAQ